MSERIDRNSPILSFSNVHEDVLRQLADEVLMNPVLPDVGGIDPAPGFTAAQWSLYAVGYEHLFLENYPHPPTISYVECAGYGYEQSGHSVEICVQTSKWYPAGQEDGNKPIQNIGMWLEEESIPITGYIDKNMLPGKIIFDLNEVEVGRSATTGICNSCTDKLKSSRMKSE